jgi:hypothetical protein
VLGFASDGWRRLTACPARFTPGVQRGWVTQNHADATSHAPDALMAINTSDQTRTQGGLTRRRSPTSDAAPIGTDAGGWIVVEVTIQPPLWRHRRAIDGHHGDGGQCEAYA